MKICQECAFHKRIPVQFNGRQALGSACMSPECRDPVDGSPLPCSTARTNESFCGLKTARYYKNIEVPKQEAETSNVIQISK